MWGDLSLIPELEGNHARQQNLLRERSVESEAAFGEYVRSTRTPEAIVVKRSAPAHGVGDHDCKHYVLGSTKYPNLFKTGSTKKTVDERLERIMSEQPPDLGFFVCATHHHEDCFEHEVRLKLDTWGYQKPPAEWGVKGYEFRVGSFEGILHAIDAVKKAHELKCEDLKGHAQRLQERREAAEIEEQELDLPIKRLKLNKEQFELDKAKRDYELDWEARRLDLDLRKRVVCG